MGAIRFVLVVGGGVAAYLLLRYLWLKFVNNAIRRKRGLPPRVPDAIPFLGHALNFGADASGFLARCRKDYGPVFTVLLAGKYMTYITSLNGVKAMFKERTALSFAEVAKKFTVDVFGASPAAVEPALDNGLHRQYAAHLHARAATLDLTMRSRASLVKNIPKVFKAGSDSDVELFEAVFVTMFRASCDALYGASATHLSDDAALAAFRAFDDAFHVIAGGAPSWAVPRAAHKGRSFLADLFTDSSSYPDCSPLIAARDRLARELNAPDADRKQVQMILMWAANGNTIPTAFWAVYHVLKQRLVDRVRAEAAAAWAAHPTDAPAALAAMPLLDDVVTESLRMASSTLMLRQVVAKAGYNFTWPTLAAEAGRDHTPVSGGGYHLPKATLLVAYSGVFHDDPAAFDDPHAFKLKRFKSTTTAERDGLLSFGGGVSLCPGRHFARNEIKLFVSSLLSRYDVALKQPDADPGRDNARVGLGVFRPCNPVMVAVTPVAAAAAAAAAE